MNGLRFPSSFSERYILEKAVEFVATVDGESRAYRIEAFHAPGAKNAYITRAYVEETIKLQPAYPAHANPIEARVWIAAEHFPDGRKPAESSADEALEQAMGLFAAERLTKKPHPRS